MPTFFRMREAQNVMISSKVKLPLPWREGMKGRGIDEGEG
jgi:hypothetical protein